MTPEEMRHATGLGPGWKLIWVGADPPKAVPHLCATLYGLGRSLEESWTDLSYAPTAAVGIEVAKCEGCRIAYVRRAGD